MTHDVAAIPRPHQPIVAHRKHDVRLTGCARPSHDLVDTAEEVVDDPGRRRLILAAMCLALVAVVASVSALNVAQQALAVDLIAERIRSLGFPAPGSYSEYAKLTSIPEAEGVPSAEVMIAQLVEGQEAVVRTARAVFPLLAVMFIGVLVITYWAPLSTYLPSLFAR